MQLRENITDCSIAPPAPVLLPPCPVQSSGDMGNGTQGWTGGAVLGRGWAEPWGLTHSLGGNPENEGIHIRGGLGGNPENEGDSHFRGLTHRLGMKS